MASCFKGDNEGFCKGAGVKMGPGSGVQSGRVGSDPDPDSDSINGDSDLLDPGRRKIVHLTDLRRDSEFRANVNLLAKRGEEIQDISMGSPTRKSFGPYHNLPGLDRDKLRL